MSVVPKSPGAPRRRVAILVGALLVIIAVGVGIYAFAHKGNTAGPTPTSSAGPGTPSATPEPSRASVSPTQTPSSSPSVQSSPNSPSDQPSTGSAQPTTAPPPSLPPTTESGEPTVVPSKAIKTAKARLRDKGDLGNGVEISVSRIESVKGKAQGPGEIAGPALRITIKVDNLSRKSIPMNLALVNVYYGKSSTPASPLSGPGVVPLAKPIPPRESAAGRYVFGVPKSERNRVQVEFSYTTEAPTVLFTGSV